MIRSTLTVAFATLSLTLASGAALAEGDADAGKKVYNKCRACHAVEDGVNKIGPHLYNVIGREAGAVEGYSYSSAMAESGLVWDEANLSAYLEDPKGLVPGTKMAFAGLKKPEDIANVIAYLESVAE